eukprot:1144026-Pelagomonas_calceolata.AAC.5
MKLHALASMLNNLLALLATKALLSKLLSTLIIEFRLGVLLVTLLIPIEVFSWWRGYTVFRPQVVMTGVCSAESVLHLLIELSW